jgi:hypothetical protein
LKSTAFKTKAGTIHSVNELHLTRKCIKTRMNAQGDWGGIFDIRAITPEELLDISMTVGDYRASISFGPWIRSPEMLDDARPKDFEVKEVKKRSAGSDLLNNDPLLPELSTEILCSPVKAFRAAQVWGDARSRKINRIGKELRFGFVSRLDSLLTHPFGKHPNPWNPTVTRLRAIDWHLAVLVRLLRSWRAAGQNRALWLARNPRDVEAIERAKRNVVRVRQLEVGHPYSMTFFPWEPGFRELQRSGSGILGATSDWSQECAQIQPQRSIRHAAETVGYLMFDQVLVAGVALKFCPRCDGIFESKKDYCCVNCGSWKEYRDRYEDNTSKLNLLRVETGSKAITEWNDMKGRRAGHSCRKYLETRLRQTFFNGKPLIEPSPRHSRLVGGWISASRSAMNSDERQKLIRSCGSSQKVDDLLELIARFL